MLKWEVYIYLQNNKIKTFAQILFSTEVDNEQSHLTIEKCYFGFFKHSESLHQSVKNATYMLNWVAFLTSMQHQIRKRNRREKIEMYRNNHLWMPCYMTFALKTNEENTPQLKTKNGDNFLLRAYSSYPTIKITKGGNLNGNIRSCKAKKKVF